jgi:hypothetical protein
VSLALRTPHVRSLPATPRQWSASRNPGCGRCAGRSSSDARFCRWSVVQRHDAHPPKSGNFSEKPATSVSVHLSLRWSAGARSDKIIEARSSWCAGYAVGSSRHP